MPDEQFPQPAAEAAPEGKPDGSNVRVFPAHLKPEWFDKDAPIPSFMETNENWMNQASLADETVHVRMGDGSYQKTMYPIHLGLWLLQGHGVIIAEPKEEA